MGAVEGGRRVVDWGGGEFYGRVMSRLIDRCYRDPLDVVWLGVARRLGWTVVRSDEVYASWDGEHTLTLSTPEHLDADDCLAQMILHEICHALVEGARAPGLLDWGLFGFGDEDAVREHACHRLQAAFADTVGLRAFFAVTTDWRPYYDALPKDPLGAGDDPAIERAQKAWVAAAGGAWWGAIMEGLAATAVIAAVVSPLADAGDLWAPDVTGRGRG